MIAILVLIVSLNAIQCQDFCHLMKTDNKYEGIHVYHSNPQNAYIMYTNGNQWEFGFDGKGILKMKTNSQKPINEKIVNRFSGSDYDCNVTQQSNKSPIETKCLVGGTERKDSVSQYDLNAIIFRASKTRANDWVVIYIKDGPKIWCYSPKPQNPSERLVKNESECKQKVGWTSLLLKSMDRSIVDTIEGIVDTIIGTTITGYHIFSNRDNRPHYCSQSIFGETIQCNSAVNWTRIYPDCFPPKETSDSNYWLTIVLPLVIIALLLVIIGIGIWIWKKKTAVVPEPEPAGRPDDQQSVAQQNPRLAIDGTDVGQPSAPQNVIALPGAPPPPPSRPLPAIGAPPLRRALGRGLVPRMPVSGGHKPRGEFRPPNP